MRALGLFGTLIIASFKSLGFRFQLSSLSINIGTPLSYRMGATEPINVKVDASIKSPSSIPNTLSARWSPAVALR